MVVGPLDRGGVLLLLLLLGLGLPILLRLVLLLGLLIKGLGRALRCLLKVAWRGRRLLVQLLHVKSVGVVQAWGQLCTGHKRDSTSDGGRHKAKGLGAEAVLLMALEGTAGSSFPRPSWSPSKKCSCCCHRYAVCQHRIFDFVL